MKVIIVGYGNMGHEIENVLLKRNHTIVCRIDSEPGRGDLETLTPQYLEQADMVIEFAFGPSVLENARMYAQAGVSAVVGTTGWDKDRHTVREVIEKSDSGYLWGSNFSIGAQLFFILVAKAASLVNNVPDYDILLSEAHHKMKKDSPSGTALTAGGLILRACERKKRIVTDKLDRKIKADELHISSLRGGSIPGIHSLWLDSEADTIEIKHTARNRGGFALGAVMAAEWLAGKKGFYCVEDFIQETLG